MHAEAHVVSLKVMCCFESHSWLRWHATANKTCLIYYMLHSGYLIKNNTRLQLVLCHFVTVTLMFPCLPCMSCSLLTASHAHSSPKQLYPHTHHQTHCYPCIAMPLWPAQLQLRPLRRDHQPCSLILQHLTSHCFVSLMLQAWACKIRGVSSLGHGQPAGGCC